MAGIDETVTGALRQTADPALAAELASLWEAARQAANEHAAMVEFTERLTAGGRRALALDIVRQVVAARQDLPWPLMMQAGLESAAGRHEVALAIGHTLQERFPAFERAAHVLLAALTRLRRFDEAARVLQAAQDRNPDAPWLLADAATLAEARGDWPALLAAARDWRAAAPDRAQPIIAIVTALTGLRRFDEAEQTVGEAMAAFPALGAVRRAAAALAEAKGDIGSAFARWAELCDTQPDSKVGFAGIMALARRTRRLDQMGDRMTQALARFPRDREILTLGATIAGFQDWEESDRLWQRLEALFPADPEIALNVATVMIGVRRERKRHLAEVRRRLVLVHARFPAYVPAYVAHLEALRLAGSLDEAAERAAEWAERFPTDIRLALARIAVAEERGAYDDAIDQVQALRARERPTASLEATYVRVLSRAGRLEAAEAACLKGLEAYPDDRDLLSEHARLASRRADWPEAVARWTEAQRRRPSDWKITEELRLLRQQLAGEEIGGAAAPLSEEEASNVFSRFESLGGTTTGCEFGMVQSQFGSRHVSLLRWTKTDIALLTEAIERELDGVGAEENTRLTTVRVSADREEYVTSDKRFDMASNTFINITDAPADKMFQQTCRRMRFLRGKLIEDLNAAEKVFVYKVAHDVGDEALRRLHRALKRYGDVKLMCVLAADADHPAGSVHWLEPGLLVGYVNYFLESPQGAAKGIEFEMWKKLTLQADGLFKEEVLS
jgi:tetratricopeptide (TPR) repeat protein